MRKIIVHVLGRTASLRVCRCEGGTEHSRPKCWLLLLALRALNGGGISIMDAGNGFLAGRQQSR